MDDVTDDEAKLALSVYYRVPPDYDKKWSAGEMALMRAAVWTVIVRRTLEPSNTVSRVDKGDGE